MAISVSRFRATCLKVIRRVEARGEVVDIQRRGKVVARLAPVPTTATAAPWKRLRGSGELVADTGETVLSAREFEASR